MTSAGRVSLLHPLSPEPLLPALSVLPTASLCPRGDGDGRAPWPGSLAERDASPHLPPPSPGPCPSSRRTALRGARAAPNSAPECAPSLGACSRCAGAGKRGPSRLLQTSPEGSQAPERVRGRQWPRVPWALPPCPRSLPAGPFGPGRGTARREEGQAASALPSWARSEPRGASAPRPNPRAWPCCRVTPAPPPGLRA